MVLYAVALAAVPVLVAHGKAGVKGCNFAIIADLIDQDRYSSFEKIESAARKRALAFANQKNADALRTFMDDEEMRKAIHAVQGGSRVDSDL